MSSGKIDKFVCNVIMYTSCCYQIHQHQNIIVTMAVPHGVLTFRSEVITPPNQKINWYFIWKPHRARIRGNLKDSSGEGFPLKQDKVF